MFRGRCFWVKGGRRSEVVAVGEHFAVVFEFDHAHGVGGAAVTTSFGGIDDAPGLNAPMLWLAIDHPGDLGPAVVLGHGEAGGLDHAAFGVGTRWGRPVQAVVLARAEQERGEGESEARRKVP